MIYLYLVNSECETSFLLVSRAMTLETIKLVHDHRACRVIIGHPNILGINDVNVKHLDHCSIKNFNIDIWTGFYYRHSNLPRFDNILGRDTCCVTLKAQSLAYPLQAAKLHSHLEDFHGSKTVRIYLHAGVYRHSSDRRIAQDYEGISEETRSKEFASQKEIFATLAISLAKALGPSELHDDQDPKARHLEFHPVQHKIGNLELKREKLRDEAEYSVAKRIRKE